MTECPEKDRTRPERAVPSALPETTIPWDGGCLSGPSSAGSKGLTTDPTRPDDLATLGPTSRREGGSATGGSARSSAVGPAGDPTDRVREDRPGRPTSPAVVDTPAGVFLL